VEFAEVVRKRRMARGFTSQPLPFAAVERGVRTAQHAPSAGFAQGVSFVVVTEPDRRQASARSAGQDRCTRAGHRPWISEAPVQLVVGTSEQLYRDRYRERDKLRPDGSETEWPVPSWHTDAGAALMLLLLAAVDEGLSAAFVGVYHLRKLQAYLGIPAEHLPIGVVLVGHGAPDMFAASLARGRRPLAGVLHRERW
jgi:nitroreductase